MTEPGAAERARDAFDHDAYVRARLPNFVLAGMGLRPGDQARLRPASQPPPTAAKPTRVRPRPADTRTRGTKPADSSGAAQRGPQPPPEPPSPPPLPPDAVVPANYERHLATERAAHRVARFVVGAPLLVGGLLLVAVLLSLLVAGGVGPDEVVVNDHRGATCPVRTLSPAELRTERYWEC